MTVNNTASTVAFNGNGANTTFPFAMSLPDEGDLQVFVTDDLGVTRQLATSEYTVVLNPLSGTNPTPDGGTVTYNPSTGPLPVGWQLRLVRVLPQVQDTSISNQSIVYPPVIEQEFDYLTMLIQQGGFTLDRSFKVPLGDPLPHDVPPQALRANQVALWDANGDLIGGQFPSSSVFISAAMQPVVEAGTIEEAQILFGLNKDPRLVTGTYTLVPDDNRRTVSLQGSAFYTVNVPDPTTFQTYFVALIVNNDNRAKTLSIFGLGTPFIVYPMQQVWIARGPTTWWISRPGRWFTRLPQNFYVDPVLGSDLNDGLATGSGAFQTLAKACTILETDVDGNFTINLANGTHNLPAGGLKLGKVLPGGTSYNIVGNVSDPTQCKVVNAGGQYGIIVSDGAVVRFSGIQFEGTASFGMWILSAGTVYISDMIFAYPAGLAYHIVVWGAYLNVVGSYKIAGFANASVHIGCFYNGLVSIGNLTGPAISITLLGPIAFTSGYYLVELNATIQSQGTVTYPNAGFAVSTPKGNAQYNAIIAAGSSAIPGDLAPITSNGGYFF